MTITMVADTVDLQVQCLAIQVCLDSGKIPDALIAELEDAVENMQARCEIGLMDGDTLPVVISLPSSIEDILRRMTLEVVK